jgi:hypothetical protein
MEKVQKDEQLEDELEELKNYGFNIDELMTMLDDEEQKN